jgi:SecD/SecF fusion protein
MKNKGTVKFFAIALALVSLFHLSFTLITYRVEKKAKAYAHGDLSKEKYFLDSIANENVYNILLKKYTYNDCKERELNLGLDLRGGMHITLEVSLRDLLIELSGNNDDKTFLRAIQKTTEKSRQSQKDFISLFEESMMELDPNASLAAIFATLENKDELSLNSSNSEVIRFLNKRAEGALGSTFEVLKKRIDKFGVTQPLIQKQEGTGRIVIELPGVDDPERVRKLLQGSAKLEFWETYENQEILPYVDEVNKVLKELLKLDEDEDKEADTIQKEGSGDFFSDQEKEDVELKASMEKGEEQKKKEDLDFFTGEDTLSDTSLADASKDTGLLSGDSSIVQDQLTEEEYKKEYPLYTVLQPSLRRTEEGAYYVQGPWVGISRVADTFKVNAYLSLPEVKAVLPPDVKFAWMAKPVEGSKEFYQLVALKITTLDKNAPLDGKRVTNARVDISQLGERQVTLRMDKDGAKTWKRLTGANVERSIAIILDGYVYSAPTVQSEIGGGVSQITGNFTQTEAADLANVLNSGKLDVRVNIIEEAIVGPSLGKESINSGLMSLILGLLLVLIFMVFYYSNSGFIANLALFANLFFIVGVLASLGAALTLPGMAGIVLTIGMSVDANVLIFERIREELLGGKGIKLAIKDGYKKAYSSIIDANLTTLLVGVILYTFGSGPIHGFATILIIGICTSLFSAILITRVIFDNALQKERDIRFSSKMTSNLFNNINIRFIANRRKAYFLSGAVILVGCASLIFQGLSLGVDFKGGYSYVVRFDKDINTKDITLALEKPLEGQPMVKIFGPANQIKLTTSYLIESTDENASDSVETILGNGFRSMGLENFEILNASKVGATVADDIKSSGVWSVLFSLIGIFIYIFIRFKRWQYGLAAVITLFHDVLIILSIFSIFQYIMPFSLEIDQSFIAALLTVIGYSINDTVVVFDRIREKLSMFKQKPFLGTVNTALNETLSRTVITSLTTLLVIFVLFIFGGEIIRGFSFALLIGIVVGTYSSLFVSTPLIVEFTKKEYDEAK